MHFSAFHHFYILRECWANPAQVILSNKKPMLKVPPYLNSVCWICYTLMVSAMFQATKTLHMNLPKASSHVPFINFTCPLGSQVNSQWLLGGMRLRNSWCLLLIVTLEYLEFPNKKIVVESLSQSGKHIYFACPDKDKRNSQMHFMMSHMHIPFLCFAWCNFGLHLFW